MAHHDEAETRYLLTIYDLNVLSHPIFEVLTTAIKGKVAQKYLAKLKAMLTKCMNENPQVFEDGRAYGHEDDEHRTALELKTWHNDGKVLVQCYVNKTT